jgi:hypothetical protein
MTHTTTIVPICTKGRCERSPRGNVVVVVDEDDDDDDEGGGGLMYDIAWSVNSGIGIGGCLDGKNKLDRNDGSNKKGRCMMSQIGISFSRRITWGRMEKTLTVIVVVIIMIVDFGGWNVMHTCIPTLYNHIR